MKNGKTHIESRPGGGVKVLLVFAIVFIAFVAVGLRDGDPAVVGGGVFGAVMTLSGAYVLSGLAGEADE
jgi:hypothetical protein